VRGRAQPLEASEIAAKIDPICVERILAVFGKNGSKSGKKWPLWACF
jgi:hypothetical protein